MTDNEAFVSSAIVHLKKARDLLKESKSHRTLKRVQDALSSADGARRHARRVDSGFGTVNAVKRGNHFHDVEDSIPAFDPDC